MSVTVLAMFNDGSSLLHKFDLEHRGTGQVNSTD
jgi:hypothetical protein